MSDRVAVDRLRRTAPVILPSLLMCDFGNLEQEVRRLEEAGVEALHLDIMDGCFVPNLTYGMPIVEALRRITDLPLDAHLMIVQPQRYVDQFVDAGADVITFHVEAVEDPRPVLAQIRGRGVGAGIALNPATPLTRIEGCLDLCDLVLVMSVPAGFGGQSFDEVAFEKLRQLRERLPAEVMLEVDGGVNDQTIAACAAAGARYFVVGSAIFRHDDYSGVVRRLTELASCC
jgi:ribulose-phosphate 3-epimerase